MPYLPLIVPLRAIETTMSSLAVFFFFLSLVHSVTFFTLKWYWFLLFLLFLSVNHSGVFAAKFVDAPAGLCCLVAGQYIDFILPGCCYSKAWAPNQYYNVSLLSIKTWWFFKEIYRNLYCVQGYENMPKPAESEFNYPQHVHYFPAAPVSSNKRLSRTRWQQKCKGLSFLRTSDSHMKENNLFIRPLKPGQSWQMCGRKTQHAKRSCEMLFDNCKLINSSAFFHWCHGEDGKICCKTIIDL